METVIGADRILVFVLSGQRYALQLPIVDSVIRAVEVTPLPEAPAIIMGVINVHGRVVPVVNLRRRFRLKERPVDPDDQFIIATSSTGAVALPADTAAGVIKDLEIDRLPSAEILPGINYVEYVLPHDDGMVFVLDIDTVLTDDEEAAIAHSLEGLDKAE